jgi:hypothetical protein
MIFLETSVFSRQIRELADDEDYRLLQVRLMVDPLAGDLIPRSAGLRKIRLPASGRGKRGGARVIYYWATSQSVIFMLLAYAKSRQADVSADQLKTLRAIVTEEFG